MSDSMRIVTCAVASCFALTVGACSPVVNGGLDAMTRTPVSRCGEGQLTGRSPPPAEVAAHRRFALPVLDIPAAGPDRDWGLSLVLVVDTSGRVACYTTEEPYGRPQAMDGPRLELVKAMSTWRYDPFVRDGQSTAAIVREDVREQRRPTHHVAPPDVPLGQTTLSLARGVCFGPCAAYSVAVAGGGTVTYDGHQFADILGQHRYPVPVGNVDALVQDMKRKDLWSMDQAYEALVTDHPTQLLTLRMGDRTQSIRDYAGPMVGMPLAITEFQEHMDRATRATEWTRLSLFSLEVLEREGFDFRSQEAAEILSRAVSNRRGTDEPAMLRLIELGAPLQVETREPAGAGRPPSLLEQALDHHRTTLVAPLIARGELQSGGRLDQRKLDAAFQAAIQGGRLAPVQALWNHGGPANRPALHFADQEEGTEELRSERSPVTLLLKRPYDDDAWEGRQIAQWLAVQNVDLKAHGANGDTLLHAAVDSGDIAFVRYLLGEGLDVSARNRSGLPALGSAHDEDVALLLLQDGSDWRMNDDGNGFVEYARQQHWGRVLSWIKAQGG